MFIVTKETAEAYLKGRASTADSASAPPPAAATKPVPSEEPTPVTPAKPASSGATGITWTGDIPPQKWMNFYTKVLSKFASARGLKLTLKVEVTPEAGVSKQKIDETKSAQRELGLNDDVSGK
jgi:hypothetical protein